MKRILSSGLWMLMVFFALTACGNGGGGDGNGGGFTTDYWAVSFGGSEVPTADDYESSFLKLDVPGTALSNGTSGTMKYSIIESSSGMTNSGSAALSIDAYGLMNISVAGDDPSFGGATPDGSVMFGLDPVQDTGVEEWVSLVVGVKRASGMSNADGTGDYYCGVMEFEISDVSVGLLDLTLDGAGGYDSVGVGPGSYSISANGTLTITPDGDDFTLRGAIRKDGEVFVVHLYDELGLGPESGVLICVKDAGGHTTEDLQGNYRFGLMEVEPGLSPQTTLGEIFFDGTIGVSGAILTNTSGLVDEPEGFMLNYKVSGGFLETGEGPEPLYITSDADFFLIIKESAPSGFVFVGTKFTPPGFHSEYFATSVRGDAIANIGGGAYSLNAMGSSIAPGESGTLGVRWLFDVDLAYVSQTMPFTVDSAGFINVPDSGGGSPTWGFINTTSGALVMAATDQTTDETVTLLPGVVAGSGLTNTTVTLSGIYNCAGIGSSAAPDIILNFTGDGEVSLSEGSSPPDNLYYGLAGNGLFTLHDSSEFALGMVNPDANMVTFTIGELVLCLKQPVSLDFDSFIGTYVYGTLELDTAASPDIRSELGTAVITNSTAFDGEVTPTVLYNSTGMIGSPSAGSAAPLFLNTTSHAFELGGAGGIPVWVSDDYNMFVFGDNSGDGFFVFGVRKE